MRPWFLACLLAACGGDTEPAPAGGAAGKPEGFARWPADTVVVLRLPAPERLAAAEQGVAAFLNALGRGTGAPAEILYGVATPEGMAPKAPPFAALTAAGGWMRVLPASDMAALRRSLAPGTDVVAQETDDRLVLFKGTLPGNGAEEPLPDGDLAIRVRHHPILSVIAESGDLLEAGIDVGGAGLDARVRLVTGPNSPTRDLLGRAAKGEGGLLDYLPPGTFLRVETTLPPVFVAAGVTRRLARHLGLAEAKDRTILERLLREALSGADPVTGLAIGVEARGGEISVVVVARDAAGPDSPVLKKLRAEERSAYGALVLDRRASPAGHGWFAWAAQATPEIEDLPECLWTTVNLLSDEAKGLPVAYAAFDGWSVLAMGPRADALAVATRDRLTGGSSRTTGAEELRRLRESRDGDYVIGIVVEAGAAELPPADVKALVASFGGLEGAPGAKAFAAAGFRTPDALEFLARAYY